MTSQRPPRMPRGYRRPDVERRFSSYRADERDEFEVDRSRILHSAAFRRLSGKTQVFGIGQSDFFRTRLTHSLEVSQIAKGLALAIGGVSPELCEAAGLAHDIGHPPFGHRGEQVLQKLMHPFGGFEANAQNFRVLTHLEVKFVDFPGLDLTRATLDALFKYKDPFAEDKSKFFYIEDSQVVEWISGDRTDQSLECQIMDFADDIAYAVHDLEDGVHSGMITEARATRHAEDILSAAREKNRQVKETDVSWAIEQIREMSGLRDTTVVETKAMRKQVTSRLIKDFIMGRIVTERSRPWPNSRYRRSLTRRPVTDRRLIALKQLSYQLLIDDPRVQTLEARAGRILTELFTFFSDPSSTRAYPEDFRPFFKAATTDEQRARVACDYIAGMTDQYAERVYERLFTPERAALQDY